MDNPANARADGAYERALAAYREKSYEVARRWVVEALAHNRQHAGARALLGRLDEARQPASPFQPAASGPEVISTDPTVLISRASRPASADPIEPTVMISRDEPWRRVDDTDPRPAVPPLRRTPAPAAEPTIIAPRKERGVGREPRSRQPSSGRARSAAGQRLWSWSWPFEARGTLIAVAAVAVGVLLVWGAFRTFRWIWPAGQLLTVTKPVGGTIVGPGIECGTRGTDCSTTRPTGEAVELEARADKDYVFSGFTGDCAPTGRMSMAQARTCGATFDPVAQAQRAVTFTLTINKPEGGTVVGAGGILCGTMGSTCSAEIPSGAPVTLKGEAADGFTWEQFTGDCPSTGEMTMTSAKTCGVVFARSSAPMNQGPVGPPVARYPERRPTPKPPVLPPSNPVTQQPPPSAPTVAVGTPQGPTPTASTPVSTTPEKPPPPPISAEDHAKKEIQQLVKNYCAALDTLKPATIRSLFHLDNERELRDKFKEYKSIKCSVSSPPEYDRLDASESGGAQVKFGMKQIVEMRSGGAPKTIETIVTMVVSRRDFQSPWLIDRLRHEEKPKS